MATMTRLIRVFMTLALVATALAAPGPMLGSLFQRQRPGNPTTMPFQPPSFSTSVSTSSSSSEPSSGPSSFQFRPPSFSTSVSTTISSPESSSGPSSFQFQPPFSTSTSTTSSESEPSSFQFRPPSFSTSVSTTISSPESSSGPSSFQFRPPFSTSTSTSESSSEPSSFQFRPPFSTSTSTSESSSEPSLASFSLELRENTPVTDFKSRPSPTDSECTPGDRKCHASLDYVLFCNDDNKWLEYSQCQDGTFCHRLHMICVHEVLDSAAVFTPAPTLALTSPIHGVRDAQCKEGDRRCSLLFNRVDRCNSDDDWVTYHNCRKSELCDESTLECLPRISYGGNGSMPHGPVNSNRTGAVLT
ncbi:hypothetical protein F5B17DRAFT_385133 [Nemania serpens]|nr:hypothetical protein F5B17DRAFT_385133 [Nemania serpens]